MRIFSHVTQRRNTTYITPIIPITTYHPSFPSRDTSVLACNILYVRMFSHLIQRRNTTYVTPIITLSTYYPSFPSCDTGWRRLIGSPKLQIIFHKRATKYRALLRKMTYKDKGSYESSPPCTSVLAYNILYVRTCSRM